MDLTTLTRSVELLRRRRWTEAAPGKDRRERWLRLSKAGEEELARLEPVWKKAQAEVQQRLGSERWDGLMALFDRCREPLTMAASVGLAMKGFGRKGVDMSESRSLQWGRWLLGLLGVWLAGVSVASGM